MTLPTAKEYYRLLLDDPYIETHFLSHESFFMWKEDYVKYVGHQLKFPVTTEGIDQFITGDANGKYVSPVEDHWLDETIREGRKTFRQRREE